MYKRNDKRYLYYLINSYLENKIDEIALCDGMYYSFLHEIDNSILNETELEAFSKLEKITSRFSKFEEDYELDPKAFTTKEEIRHAVVEVKDKLKNEFPVDNKL